MTDVNGSTSLTSILTRAQDLAETTGNDAQQIGLRYQIAKVILTARLEPEFGDYVVRATEAFEQSRPKFPPNPTRDAEYEKLKELEAEAKRLYLAGDWCGAERLFIAGDELRDSHEPRSPLTAQVQFLQWTLEAGDLVAAEVLLRTKDWHHPITRIEMARMVAEAYVAAGQSARGVGVLMNMRPSPQQPNVAETLSWLGKAFWNLAAFSQARSSFREASKASIAAAKEKVSLPLYGYSNAEPLSIARLQMAIDDHEGAQATLRGVMGLAADYEFNPAPPRPKDMPTARIWIAFPSLKPESKRWVESRADRARLFARAGFEDEALAVLREPAVAQPTILENIARGQAERGDFAAAFLTLERLELEPLETKPTPSQVTIHPDGRISHFTQSEQSRKVEKPERKEPCRRAAFSIAVNAVRLGDAKSFHEAEAIGLRVAPVDWPQRLSGQLARQLKRLVRSEGVERALKFVETFEDRDRRLFGLMSVAEAMAGIRDVLDSDLWP